MQEEDEIKTEIFEEDMAANANLSLRQLGEDPHKHLMESHVVCTSMKPHGVTEEQIELRAFLFSLKSAAKDWLYYLPSGSITTWTALKRIFLEKYFLASRAANIRKEIYGIKQQMGESLHEYWEHFKKLCASCPQHQISEHLIIQYCNEGLLSHDRSMVDAASGGVFVDKTPVQASNLIESMAANSQQFGTNRSDPMPRKNNEVNVSSLEQQLIDLTSLVRQMAVGNGQNMKVCGICTAWGHATDMCPTLQEGSAEQVNAAGGFPGPPQWNYDPYSNTYNPGWKDHPNLRYGNPQATQAPPHNQAYRPPYPQQQQHPQVPTPGEFLENIVKDLSTNTAAFQQETRASIQQLNTQMGQLATAVNMLEALNSNSLPSQTVVNPRENVSAITLRGGKELKVNEEVVKEPVQNKEEQESKVEEDDTIQEAPRDAIKQVPHYAKFLKELCTVKIKQKLKGCKRVVLGEQVSAVIQRKKYLQNARTQASKAEPKLPPDRSKVISQKSKQRKQRTNITKKLRKWVKFFLVSRMPPPPQTTFQYDSSVMLSDVEEDSANT
ncbi:uncharacterized protein [Henckelia pumila]|uniref:uncharacterized protein n=1 Tax=Henckelia pumila TaxID=405737 RepID=UPI003C6E9A27